MTVAATKVDIDASTTPASPVPETVTGPLFVNLVAIATIGLLLFRALNGISFDWDGLAYHLPFAARVTGMCDKSCYEFGPYLEAVYDSFPVAAELLQGILWRLGGRAEYATFANLLPFLGFAVYLRRCFAVPMPMTILALLAIPLFQIHVTSLYVDCVVGLAMSVVILSVYDFISQPEKFGIGKAITLGVCAVFVGNAKILIWPVLCVALASVIAYIFSSRRFVLFDGRPMSPPRRRVIAALVAVVAVCSAGTAIANAIRFGNPFYPIALSFGPINLPGFLKTSADNSVSYAWRDVGGPVRWLLSVLEYSGYNQRYLNWQIDQGGIPQELPDFRMGGYFGVYVLLSLCFLRLALRQRPPGEKRLIAGGFSGLTLLTALLPASHELRYYLYWMIVLVSVNMILLIGNRRIEGAQSSVLGQALIGSVVAVFVAVLCITSGEYLKPSLRRSDRYVVSSGIRTLVMSKIVDGDVLCVGPDRDNQVIFYTRLFNPAVSYGVIHDAGNKLCTKELDQ